MKRNLFLHADGDSFFVACELSVRPELKGLPVIVGADRGIAVAMSPEAKKLGVTRGMPVFRIKKEFPSVVILNHTFHLYREISERMHQILLSYFTDVEVYSIDECFALVQPAEVKYFGGEEKLMKELKEEVEKTLKVSYSFGLARTKALAKQASKLEKPGGLVMLLSKEDELDALKRTPIEDIWGIGRRTVPKLKRMGLETAHDLIHASPARIQNEFSKPMSVLVKELGGESIMRVENDADPRDQQSIQSTSTFRPSSTDPRVILRELSENAEHACQNARELRLVSNKIGFFVKTSEFKYYFGEVKLEEYTSDPGAVLNSIEKEVLRMLPKRQKMRSTGVILHNLTRIEKVPLDLFGRQENALKKLAVEEVADKIREKHGHGAIKRAASMKRN